MLAGVELDNVPFSLQFNESPININCRIQFIFCNEFCDLIFYPIDGILVALKDFNRLCIFIEAAALRPRHNCH